MKTLARLALLSAAALAGCNLTYDRDGVVFNDSPSGEPNDTPAQATALTLGTDVTGTISTIADLDYFVFTVPSGGLDVRFQTFDASGVTCAVIDPRIALYDGSATLLATSDDSGINYCENLLVPLPEGTYYVVVRDSAYATPPYDYLLRTTVASYTSLDAEPNGTYATAVPLTLGTDATGTLATTFDVDHYAFTLPAGGADVRIQTFDVNGTTCAAVDPKIELYDAAGTSLATRDNNFLTNCEDLVISLPAGSYDLAVTYSWWFTPPIDYLVRTSAGARGSSTQTFSCTYTTPSAWCRQVTGTLGPTDLADGQYYCTGTYALGTCPTTNVVAGYCDAGPSSYGTGSTQRWYYYSPDYTQASAQTDCQSYAHTWVP